MCSSDLLNDVRDGGRRLLIGECVRRGWEAGLKERERRQEGRETEQLIT